MGLCCVPYIYINSQAYNTYSHGRHILFACSYVGILGDLPLSTRQPLFSASEILEKVGKPGRFFYHKV